MTSSNWGLPPDIQDSHVTFSCLCACVLTECWILLQYVANVRVRIEWHGYSKVIVMCKFTSVDTISVFYSETVLNDFWRFMVLVTLLQVLSPILHHQTLLHDNATLCKVPIIDTIGKWNFSVPIGLLSNRDD